MAIGRAIVGHEECVAGLQESRGRGLGIATHRCSVGSTGARFSRDAMPAAIAPIGPLPQQQQPGRDTQSGVRASGAI